jgi:hypothetical protein
VWQQGSSSEGTQFQNSSSGEGGFFLQVWRDVSPYFRTILGSLLKTVALLVSFTVLRLLMKIIGLPGLQGEIFEKIHSAEISVGLTLFAIFFILDLLKIRRK